MCSSDGGYNLNCDLLVFEGLWYYHFVVAQPYLLKVAGGAYRVEGDTPPLAEIQWLVDVDFGMDVIATVAQLVLEDKPIVGELTTHRLPADGVGVGMRQCSDFMGLEGAILEVEAFGGCRFGCRGHILEILELPVDPALEVILSEFGDS